MQLHSEVLGLGFNTGISVGGDNSAPNRVLVTCHWTTIKPCILQVFYSMRPLFSKFSSKDHALLLLSEKQ